MKQYPLARTLKAALVPLVTLAAERLIDTLTDLERDNDGPIQTRRRNTTTTNNSKSRGNVNGATRHGAWNRRRLSKAKIAKIRQGAAQGMTIKEIAAFANVSNSSAQRYRFGRQGRTTNA